MASWEECSLDGAPSALSKLIPKQEAPSLIARSRESCLHSRSGMTYEHSMDTDGADALTSSQEGSLARTSPQPAHAQDSTESVVGSGERWRGSFAKFDREACLWRTAQRSLIEDLAPSLEIWPEWGSMRDGECFPLAPLVLHTCDDECSLWPTPRASMAKSGFGNGQPGKGRYRAEVIARCAEIGWAPSPEMLEAELGWPEGWTALGSLAMDKYQEWLRLHGNYS